jgi:hypothetical protein
MHAYPFSIKFKLTAQQIADIIDDAFRLGKTYATDELNTTSGTSSQVPVFENEDQWNKFIEGRDGQTLHSGDAKADILFKHLQSEIRDRFAQTIDFD